MGNKHKTMLPVRLFLTWITRVLKVVLVSIDMETVLDLRHLLIVSLSKKEFTFGRDQQARIVDKNFLKGGGGDLYEILTRKKKSPSFPKNLQNPNSVGEGGGWSEEKKWDGDRPTPPPSPMLSPRCYVSDQC